MMTMPAIREIVGVYMSVFSSVSTIRPMSHSRISGLSLPETRRFHERSGDVDQCHGFPGV